MVDQGDRHTTRRTCAAAGVEPLKRSDWNRPIRRRLLAVSNLSHSFSSVLRSPRFARRCLLSVLLTAGCAPNEPEDVPQPVPRGDVPTLGAAGDVAGRRPRPSPPTVAPGTPLDEDGFASALRATGARWIVVPVFAAECGPCMTEALRLTARRPAWKATGIDVVGMGMDETSADVLRFFHATGERVDYPLYRAPWFAKQHHVEITPTVLIYSADGNLRFRTDVIESEQGIQAALDEKLGELLGGE
ncbi:MAG: TlpA family protein disulfide reductase [Pirellulales bacterium]